MSIRVSMDFSKWAPYLHYPLTFSAFCLLLAFFIFKMVFVKNKIKLAGIIVCCIFSAYGGYLKYAEIDSSSNNKLDKNKKNSDGKNQQINIGDDGINVDNSGSGKQINNFNKK